MGKSKNQEYIDLYAEMAMENMRLYGIPASVTLAQGILESANGQSQLAIKENNHFGIKASKSWIESGGRYGLYTDDKPNEKFCSYDSVLDSYAHHSRVLANSSRYRACFSLDPSDYKGWAWGLDKGGYATAGSYAPALINIIERNDLGKYDQMVIEQMKAQGLVPGQGTPAVAQAQSRAPAQTPTTVQSQGVGYSFPLAKAEFLHVSSPYGNRVDPMDHSKQQMHKGIDIRCTNEPLLATEDNGRVISVNQDTGTAGGKSVTIEYDRPDGSKMQVFYCHLSSIDVKVGDTVSAGQQIGVSGNTGTRTTGPHLHFAVSQVDADGSKRSLDPAAYLADIAQKGGINLSVLHNGENLLAKYQTPQEDRPDGLSQDNGNLLADATALSPDEWLKKLMSSEDSDLALQNGGDPIMEMMVMLFSTLMVFANQIDQKSQQDQMALATQIAESRQIDLTPLMPGLRECTLSINDNQQAVLSVNHGSLRFQQTLSPADMLRLNNVLTNDSLSAYDKQLGVAGIVNNLIAARQASQNYDMAMQPDQSHNLTR